MISSSIDALSDCKSKDGSVSMQCKPSAKNKKEDGQLKRGR
jgi:hypothetical protein